MSKDYAKRNFSRKKTKKSNFPLWLISVLLLLAFIAGLIITNKQPQYNYLSLKKIITATINLKKKSLLYFKPAPQIPSDANTQITKTTNVPAPIFKFYSTLPKKKSTQHTTQEYELEVAVTKDFAAADSLKAELILLGFTVSVTPIYKNGTQKYCVSIGPYETKESAIADQQKLNQNKIRSSLKKIR